MKQKIELLVWNHEVLPTNVGGCPGINGEGRGGEGPYLSDEVRNILIAICPHQHTILTRYGYMESKEGTAALQTEEGLRRKIKKAVMDFQVGLYIFVFGGFHDIDYPGICWTQPDRSCGWEDSGNDGDTKVNIDLPSSQLGMLTPTA